MKYNYKYFLFGSIPCEEYEENMSIEDVNFKDFDGALFEYDEMYNSPSDLLDAYDGWGGFTELSEHEYNYAKEKLKI